MLTTLFKNKTQSVISNSMTGLNLTSEFAARIIFSESVFINLNIQLVATKAKSYE